MATTAAVIAAGATVAAAGASAAGAASSGKGGGGPATPEIEKWERIFNRGTADLLTEERRVMEDALSQANLMQPELYSLLGYEPVYDTAGPDLAGLGKQYDDARGAWEQGRARMSEIDTEIAAIRREKANKKGKAGKGGLTRDAARQVRELEKEKQRLKTDNPKRLTELQQAERLLGEAQTTPRRITGFRKTQAADPTGAYTGNDLYRMALDLENQTLVRALKGEEPIDSTLRTQWEEQEKVLRERLRRTLGPDYESSSAGMEALANFDRERSQSFETYNREVIGQFSELTQNRAASLSALTGERMNQLLAPSNAQAQRALLLGQAAGDRTAFIASQQRERGITMEGARAKWEAEQVNAAARAQMFQGLAGSLSSLGQGAMGLATSDYAQSFRSNAGTGAARSAGAANNAIRYGQGAADPSRYSALG